MAEIVTLKMQRREDGGLRVWSDKVGGLILSGSDPEKVMSKIWPGLVALKAEPQK